MTVNEGIRVKEVSECFICNEKGISIYRRIRDRLFNSPGIWDIVCCPKCGLVWLNPRPVSEDIGKLYTRYYTHIAPEYASHKPALLRQVVKRIILAVAYGYNNKSMGKLERIAGRLLSWLSPLRDIIGKEVMWLDARSRGRILDIGCGTGVFLAQMRDLGWQVTGIEPDREAVRTAREHFGIRAHHGTLEEVHFPDKHFDAITMDNVIEHVPNLIDVLKECRRLLKPKGKLIIITPNILSLGHGIFRQGWRGLEPPRHFFLFSPRIIKVFAVKANLKILKVWTTEQYARGIWTASRLICRYGASPIDPQKKFYLLLKIEGLVFQMIESMIPKAFNNKEEIVLVATRE